MLRCRVFGHGTWHRGRDQAGQVVKVCDRCLQSFSPLLGSDVKTDGPCQQQRDVAGNPVYTVTRERVVAFSKRGSR